jgi:hypothetical protein
LTVPDAIRIGATMVTKYDIAPDQCDCDPAVVRVCGYGTKETALHRCPNQPKRPKGLT